MYKSTEKHYQVIRLVTCHDHVKNSDCEVVAIAGSV
jgi:hypothetical protein